MNNFLRTERTEPADFNLCDFYDLLNYWRTTHANVTPSHGNVDQERNGTERANLHLISIQGKSHSVNNHVVPKPPTSRGLRRFTFPISTEMSPLLRLFFFFPSFLPQKITRKDPNPLIVPLCESYHLFLSLRSQSVNSAHHHHHHHLGKHPPWLLLHLLLEFRLL